MTRNKSFFTDYQEIDGRFVTFGESPKGGKITRKYKIRTGKLDFEDVYFVKELKFNLFSVSQMCDKKNSVLFTKTECLVLSPNFKLLDESQVLLKVPRHDNMYSFDLKNVVPSGGLTCLFAKATIDESNLWHRRLGHINFKTMNKLVRGNLVRGLPSKLFENDHTCVACQKGKQHKASCKTKLVSSISQPVQMLHVDLFGPTSVRSINDKTYFLIVTDDFSSNGWKSDVYNTQEALTIIENKAKVRTCRNKPQVSSSGGSSIQNDAITALTKQVEALVHHIFSMQEAYNQNQEAPIELMKTQMGQLEEAFKERPLDMLPSHTETYPQEKTESDTTMSGLTLDGSFIPHSEFPFIKHKEKTGDHNGSGGNF
ncbi:putative ribonuclease H-like domain-containing protein [Tanacetum coccineum]